MTYIKDLQNKVAAMSDQFDIKSIEIGLLQSEMVDTLKPNRLLSELNSDIIDMMNDLIEYEKKTKLTPRMQASKKRLINMLFVASELSELGSRINSLKLFNRELAGSIQLLRVENADLRKQLNICNETSQEL